METGVILAGGKGTRLLPLTNVTNKHLLAVYDRPMIEYPIYSLQQLGCKKIVIVTGGEHIGKFAEYLGDGSRYGVEFIYKVQKEAGGIAQALKCAEDHATGLFPVILGDNYFETIYKVDKPSIFVTESLTPQRFGVYANEAIVEKPETPESNLIVTGLYFYDQRVFDIIETLVPSERGELEITDVNNWYLGEGAQIVKYEGFWSDMGTPDSLLDVANYRRTL